MVLTLEMIKQLVLINGVGGIIAFVLFCISRTPK